MKRDVSNKQRMAVELVAIFLVGGAVLWTKAAPGQQPAQKATSEQSTSSQVVADVVTTHHLIIVDQDGNACAHLFDGPFGANLQLLHHTGDGAVVLSASGDSSFLKLVGAKGAADLSAGSDVYGDGSYLNLMGGSNNANQMLLTEVNNGDAKISVKNASKKVSYSVPLQPVKEQR